MKVLFVIPSLRYGGAARQLTLLAAGLPAAQFERRVCVLGEAGPWIEDLRRAGVTVEVFGWRHVLDPRPFRGLRRAVRDFRPDVIHAWQAPALGAVALAGWGSGAAVVASWPFRSRRRGGWLGRAQRFLLARCAAVTVPTILEAERCKALGLPAARVHTVLPGVVPDAGTSGEPAPLSSLPDGARVVAAVGPLLPEKGLRDAVWAVDILKELFRDLHLVLVGAGPDRFRLEQFAHAIHATGRVHFTGACPDVAGLLGRAEVVWVPDRVQSSLNAVLEAMAAGRPVVASRLPETAELVRDGETGLLVPPGDKAALARQTRRLLDDADLR
ncbi:MAG TPA: glycosyltransferase, partial [Gemmataceae bacterium]|nr:glycosyltransferase [Gemmataceae bacterium]